MRHAVSAATVAGSGVSPQASSTRAHSFRIGAEFRDGEKFVGIGGEAEIDHAARGIERDAACLQRAQTIDGGGERESQFLRFRAAGIVNDASVRHHEGPAEALARQGRAPPRRRTSIIRSTAAG